MVLVCVVFYSKRNRCIYSSTISLTAPYPFFSMVKVEGKRRQNWTQPFRYKMLEFFFFALNIIYFYLQNACITYFWPNQYRLLHLIQYKCDKGKNNLQNVVWIEYLLFKRNEIAIICNRLWLLRQVPQRTCISHSAPAKFCWRPLFRNIDGECLEEGHRTTAPPIIFCIILIIRIQA